MKRLIVLLMLAVASLPALPDFVEIHPFLRFVIEKRLEGELLGRRELDLA